MAGGPGHRSEDDLERRLREIAARSDPVPDAVVGRARAAGRARAPERSELLDLVYDSIVDDALVEVRADERFRLLRFAGAGLLLELRLGACPADTGFSAWTAPARAVEACLGTEHETRVLSVEPDGTIVSPGVARTPARVLVAVDIAGNIRPFHTSWFSP
jgi:hypothetical protein